MLNILLKKSEEALLIHNVMNRYDRHKYGKGLVKTLRALIESGMYRRGFWSLVSGRPYFSMTNPVGAIGEKLKYGHIKGGELYIPAPIGASEVIKAASGRFVKTDGSGRVEVAGDGSTELVGHLEHNDETVSATEGADIGVLNVDRSAVYRIPVNSGTYAAAMKYDTCDLSVSSNIQGVQLDASAEDTVIVVDGDTTNNNWVDVQINPIKLGATGVV